MKKYLRKFYPGIILFAFFAILTGIEEKAGSSSTPPPPQQGMLKKNNDNKRQLSPAVTYAIKAGLNTSSHTLTVTERIVWKNQTRFGTDKVFLHLYPNAYSSSESKFMHGRPLDEDQSTRLLFNRILVNGKTKELYYHFPDENYKADSTVGYIRLDTTLNSGDSVLIDLDFTLFVPKAFGRWGRDTGDDIYFFAQWFPKAGVFRNKYWYCEPFHSFAEFYSDFARYDLELSIPDEYTAASSAGTTGVSRESGMVKYNFTADYVTDLSFVVHRNLEYFPERYISKSGKTINIYYYLRSINSSNLPRLSRAVSKSVEYLEKNIGEYPFTNLTIVDIPPGMGEVANMEYPGLFTFEAGFFPAIETRYPEKIIIHELIHQYFYATVANNETKEAWLDEGITSFLTSKIISEVYGRQNSSFRVFNYYTFDGIEFLNLRGLPVIYTLTSAEVPVFTSALVPYYRYARAGSLSQPSDQLFNAGTYFAITYSKAELLFATIDRYLPEGKLLRILSEYYRTYKFRHAAPEDLLKLINRNGSPEVEQLIKVFYKTAAACDYSVTGIEERGDVVNVFVQRVEDAVIPIKVALYTERDTLVKTVTPSDRITRVVFNTPDNIIGAEVDPGRRNMLDINFANNSFASNYSAEGLIYITLRWFFWMQSLLIVSGGLA
ncbi:MAG: M1 family metallopeptidase [Ignavibacteriaceae bacterium]|nr:M1 family metallopeptidase [Ignavibacteriaceae bacterium]